MKIELERIREQIQNVEWYAMSQVTPFGCDGAGKL